MSIIVPAILAESFDEFEKKLRLIEPYTDLIQVDVLDGSMFGVTNWFDPVKVGSLRTDVKMELHLMVENPIPIIDEWKQHVPGLVRAIVHDEISRPTGVVIDHIKEVLKLEAGVAINPETPLSALEGVMHVIDQLTMMGVHPGASGQAFLGDSILEKIKQARHHREDLIIEMDGGLTDEIIDSLVQAGANRLCASSLVFKDSDPAGKLQELNKRLGGQ
ncbi:MAG: hypothetical protein HQ488_00280 [Parcubacteria group bacterium]|nr:hypothetical protein [Parcubacteria group bacterium]